MDLTCLTDLPAGARAKRSVEKVSHPDSNTHAVLLYGSDGAGHFSLTRWLAHRWLCMNAETADSCGECSACLGVQRERNPDLLIVGPKGPSRWITRDAIFGQGTETGPSAQAFLRSAPLTSRNKVLIIEHADRMNKDSANAFLKTLEEPPAYAKICLVTNEPGSLLATILSRCLAIACEMPAPTADRVTDPDAAKVASFFAGRSPETAEFVLTHLKCFTALYDFTHQLGSMEPIDAFRLTESFIAICSDFEKQAQVGAREAQTTCLSYLAKGLRNLSVMQEAGTAASPVHPATKLAELAEVHRRVQGNGNLSLALDAFFARALQ